MASRFDFKIHKTSWGIFISLTAEFVPVDPSYTGYYSDKLFPVTDEVWLELHRGFPRLNEDEQQMMVLGARLILENHAANHSLTPGIIKILNLAYTLSEYQPEGLACAMMGWGAQEWNVPIMEIPIRYDKSKNVYFFKFPGLPEMGTHLVNGRIVIE